MLLSEQLQASDKSCDIQMFASDIDQDALAVARAGIYPENVAADVTSERLRHFFVKGEHTHRINKEIREAVVFAQQNLVSDPPFSKLDLICCRNLLIYLGAVLQKKVLQVFHYALLPNRFLMLGTSESIGTHADLFALADKKQRIYTRKAMAGLPRYQEPAMEFAMPAGTLVEANGPLQAYRRWGSRSRPNA